MHFLVRVRGKGRRRKALKHGCSAPAARAGVVPDAKDSQARAGLLIPPKQGLQVRGPRRLHLGVDFVEHQQPPGHDLAAPAERAGDRPLDFNHKVHAGHGGLGVRAQRAEDQEQGIAEAAGLEAVDKTRVELVSQGTAKEKLQRQGTLADA